MIDIVAPLALYLVTALLALGAVHRFVHRLSRAAVLALLALPLTFTGPALLSGKIFAPVDELYAWEPWAAERDRFSIADPGHAESADLAVQIIPWHAAVRWSWRQGEWPLWNPFMLTGDTLQQCAQPAPYHPLNVISLALPLRQALTPLASLVLFVAALSAFCWGRELGCTEAPALVGAAAFMASGFLIFWLLWPLATTWAAFPLLLAGLRRAAHESGPRAVGMMTVGLAFQVLGGHPESSLHGLLAAAAYALCELAVSRDRAAMLRSGLVAGALAAALTAVFWAPLLDALPQSWQYHQRSANTGVAEDVPWDHARGRLVASAVPFRFGKPWEEGIPTGFFLPTASGYIGGCLFGLVLFALWRHPWRGRWLLAAFTAFGAAAGASVPVVVDLLHSLPILQVAVHRRWTVIAAFGLASLAALGAETWRRNPSMQAALCQLVVCGVSGALVLENWREMRDGGLSQPFLVTNALWLLLPSCLAILLLGLPRLRRRPEAVIWALLALALIQRTGETGRRFELNEADAFYPRPDILELLPESPEPFRFTATGEALVPNTGIFWQLEDVRGYQPLRSGLLTETYPAWPTTNEFFINRIHELDSPVLDLIGVRFAVLEDGIALPEHWRLLGRRGQLQLAENLRAAPRAFMPAQVVADETAPLSRLTAIRDFRQVSIIHPGDGPAVPPRAAGNGTGLIRTTRRGAGLDIDASTETGGWMVVTETAWRGWSATVAGRRLPVGRANHAWLAVYLEPGEHDISLRYRPLSFRIGRALSLASLAALVLTGLARGWRGRQHRPS